MEKDSATKEFNKVVIKKIPSNSVKVINCNGLYKKYNINENECYELIVSHKDIEAIYNRQFDNINDENVEIILDLAENCETGTMCNYNFTISSDGEIKLGNIMEKIKEEIEDIKRAWKKEKRKIEITIIA